MFGVWSVVAAFGRTSETTGTSSVYLKPLNNIMKPGNTFDLKGTGKALRFTPHYACMFSATPRTSLVLGVLSTAAAELPIGAAHRVPSWLLLATCMAADRHSRVESMGSCACKRT